MANLAQKTGNFFLDLLKGAAQPFRRGIGVGQELVLNNADKLGYDKQQVERARQAQKTNKIASTTSLTDSEKEDPLIAAKALAGQGAFFIPGGKAATGASTLQKILAAAKPAALSGALSGFGESQQGSEVSSTVGGAAIGGAIGGGIGLVQDIGSRLAARRASQTPTVTGKYLKNKAGFTSSKEEMAQLAKEIGIKDNFRSTQKVSVTEEAIGNMSDDIERILTDETFDQTKLADHIEKRLLDTEFVDRTPGQRDFLNGLLSRIEQAGDDALALNKIKSEIRGELANAFNAIQKGNTPAVKDQAKIAVWSAIKDTLDDVSTDVRVLNNKQATLYDLLDEFIPAAKKSSEKAGVSIPLTDAKIPTPFTKEGVVRGASAVGSTVSAPFKAVGRTAEAISKLNIPPALRNILIQGAVGSGSDAEPQPDTQQIPETTDVNISGSPDDVLSQLQQSGVSPEVAQQFVQGISGGGQQQQAGQITTDMLMAARLSLSDKEYGKVEDLYKIQQEAAKTAKEAGSASSPEGQAALNVLSELQNLYSKVQLQGLTASGPGITNKAAGAVKGKVAAFTESSPEAKVYDTQVEAFLSLLSRGLGEKGTLTDKDIDRVRKAIPGFGTSPEAAKLGWQTVKSILTNASSSNDDAAQLLNFFQSQGVSQ